LENQKYSDSLESVLVEGFIAAGYRITKKVEPDPIPESSKYGAQKCSIDEKNIVYRQGNVTPDRPGAFLTVWKRPPSPTINNNKPIPLSSNEIDYLFVRVAGHSNVASKEGAIRVAMHGIFIFPVLLLIEKGIVSSSSTRGKTGFRVFPPWSQDRGVVGTKIFSESGKKTQRWQLPYFLEIGKDGSIDSCELNKVFGHE
jgi:hypothetical protein